jgi:hypothetical protein
MLSLHRYLTLYVCTHRSNSASTSRKVMSTLADVMDVCSKLSDADVNTMIDRIQKECNSRKRKLQVAADSSESDSDSDSDELDSDSICEPHCKKPNVFVACVKKHDMVPLLSSYDFIIRDCHDDRDDRAVGVLFSVEDRLNKHVYPVHEKYSVKAQSIWVKDRPLFRVFPYSMKDQILDVADLVIVDCRKEKYCQYDWMLQVNYPYAKGGNKLNLRGLRARKTK